MAESKTFIEKTQPKHILEVMGEDLLGRLLDGYRFFLKTALTVYYKSSLVIKRLELKPRLEETLLTCPFCYEYRYTPPQYDEKCISCDKEVTLKYYNEMWMGARLFHCPFRLWEMTYPLFAGERLVGVLYGGQIIVTKEVRDWRIELKNAIEMENSGAESKDIINENEIIWDLFDDQKANEIPRESDQVKEIRLAVKARANSGEITQEKKEQLLKAINNIINKEKRIEKKTSVRDLVGRYKKFKELGATLDRALGDLYTAQKESARHEHKHSSSSTLAKLGDQLTEEPEQFWSTLDKVVESTLPDVKGYVFYKLDKYGKLFEPIRTCTYDKQLVSSDIDFGDFFGIIFNKLHDKEKKEEDLIIYSLSDRSIPRIDLFRRVVNKVNRNAKDASVIAIPLIGIDRKVVGGLVCVCVKAERSSVSSSDSYNSFLQFYADALKDIANVLSMVLDRQATKERREKELRRLTHELQVPLVAIRGAADFMIRTPGVKKFFDYDYLGDIWSWSELMGRLIDNADISRYSDKGMQLKESLTYILPDVIAPAIRQVRLLLDERGFSSLNICYTKESLQFPPLWLDRNQFQQVVFNLLSNAIKYAFKDPDAFRVEIEGFETDLVIKFRDWGPGIEHGQEELIFEEGFRGKDAEDIDVTGQGLGLWIVRQIIEAHGGNIKVTNLKWPTEFTISLPHALTYGPYR